MTRRVRLGFDIGGDPEFMEICRNYSTTRPDGRPVNVFPDSSEDPFESGIPFLPVVWSNRVTVLESSSLCLREDSHHELRQ